MGNKRVHEVAKELGIESKELIAKAKELLGLEISSHSSSISDTDITRLKIALDKEKERSTQETRIDVGGRTIVRRRREQPKPAPAEPPKVEEAVQATKLEEIKAEKILDERQREGEVQQVEHNLSSTNATRPAIQVSESSDQHSEEVNENVVTVIGAGEVEKEKEYIEKEKGQKRTSKETQHKFMIEVVGTVPDIKPKQEIPQIQKPKNAQETKSIDLQELIKSEKETKVFEKKKKDGHHRRMREFDSSDIYDEDDERMAFIAAKAKKKSKKRAELKPEITTPKAIKRTLKMQESISIQNFAKELGVKATDVIAKLLAYGVEATINQSIDFDTASIIAKDFNWEVVKAEEDLEARLVREDRPEDLMPRPPIVTVMGHVDHGKTTLLDYIRRTNVASKEAGGITQHIGAYEVKLPKGSITFIDTPGHAAFTKMRSRGAQITDIVILVVAADDGIQPQTVEAINHAKSAGVPIIVAINKIDKPGINPDKIKQDLMNYGLVSEEWGGDTIVRYISAKTGQGINELLDMILLQAEMLELKASDKGPAVGTVIESKIEKGRGPVITAIIQKGTLKKGDMIISGIYSGRVRMIFDSNGNQCISAGPSKPVEIIGLSGAPQAGDSINVVEDEKLANRIIEKRIEQQRSQKFSSIQKISIEDILNSPEKEQKVLKIILKTDVYGSVESISEAIKAESTENFKIEIIHSGVGAITESDITLASASGALIIGFNTKPEPTARSLAERERVIIKLFDIIYDVLDYVKKIVSGDLKEEKKESYIGRAEVRQVFNISKVGKIAGCMVIDGKIVRSAKVKVIRNREVIFEGKLSSLKRFKDDVREVQAGMDCGVGIEGFGDVLENDVLEFYDLV
ncbi:MAG: translation initiation factor IF-2 [Deltaproteobacteria bacterium]|nr:translation initiation factor IF-2 [Deltaproteobacteria bacterium]